MGMMLERTDPDQMDMGFGGWRNVSEASLIEILEVAGAFAVSEEEMTKHVHSLVFTGRRMQRHPPVMAGLDESIVGIIEAFDGWLYELEDLMEYEISVVGGWLSGVGENVWDAIYKLKDGEDIPEYFYEREDPFMHMDFTVNLSPSAARYLIAISEWFDEVSTELLHIADTLFSWETFDLSEYQAADFLERAGILEQEQIDSTVKEAHRLGRRLEFELVPKARETLEYTREVYAAVYGEDEVFRISQMEKSIDRAIGSLLSEAETEDPFMQMDFGEIPWYQMSEVSETARGISDDFIRSDEFAAWQESNEGMMPMYDPERYDRIMVHAEEGGIGSTHGEVIHDWREAWSVYGEYFITKYRHDVIDHLERIMDEVDHIINGVEDSHVQNGTIDDVIG